MKPSREHPLARSRLARLRPGIRWPPAAPGAATGQPEPFVLRVDGDPVPKARPRVVNGRTYTEDRTARAEHLIRAAARRAGVRPMSGPLAVYLGFWRATARPCDIDNLVKTVLDALNGIGWHDDSQVVDLTAHKAVDREHPWTMITVRREASGAVLRVDEMGDGEGTP